MNKEILILFLFVKKSYLEMSGNIIQGEFTGIQAHPHQVGLDIVSTQEWLCGGSILNQQIILTAAHCMEDYSGGSKQKVIIKYGSNNLKQSYAISMRSYKVHERYNCKSMYADLALMRVKTTIWLSNVAKRVAIMRSPPSSKTAYVAGWGAINENMELTSFLKVTQQNILSLKLCADVDLPAGTFCAASVKGSPSVGDSGGAIMIDNYIQIGVVSYKAEGYAPVAYSNVSYWYNWITENAENLACH